MGQLGLDFNNSHMPAQTCPFPTMCCFSIFWLGLINDTAQQLDITAGGSFAYKTTSEGVALLDRILENTSFTEPLLVVQPSS